MILLFAAFVAFAFPVVPVEATIPARVIVAPVTIDERRINYSRSAPIHERTRTTADKPRCVGHRSG